MKQYILSAGAAFLLMTFTSAAQLSQKSDDKKENKSRSDIENDNKFGEYDEIVIKKKNGDSTVDLRLDLQIRGDNVIINGKPLEDFTDGEVSIRLRNAKRYRLDDPSSPFRSHRGWSQEGMEDQAFLGVMTEGSKEGARILTISENSAAKKAGLKKGDIITHINNKAVYDHEQLTEIIKGLKPDEKVTIKYKRDGKEQTATATLGRRSGALSLHGPVPPVPPMAPAPGMPFHFDSEQFGDMFNFNFRSGKPRLGIKAQDMEDGKGVKVIEVDEDSPAAKAGIKEEDIITSFDGRDVNSADELARASRESKDKTSVKIQFKRKGKTQSVEVKLPKKLKTAEL